jgi:sugar/nucleoside kinase (ribokinase family)
MYDVCVVGHVTKDLIRVHGMTKQMPGGTAYYSGMALRSLGLNVAVITKVAARDEQTVLEPLARSGVHIFVGHSRFTTTFENTYTSQDLSDRIERIRAVGDPFIPEDLGKISASAFHLGPLTPAEMRPEFIEEVGRLSGLVSLDAQGFVRGIEGEAVVPQKWRSKEQVLVHVDMLKADDREATLITGDREVRRAGQRLRDFGPAEVIITTGSSGSLIFVNNETYPISSFPVASRVDPTGCGDTYMAGYIAHRLRSIDFEEAGKFAARLASAKLQIFGALTSDQVPEQLWGYWESFSRR